MPTMVVNRRIHNAPSTSNSPSGSKKTDRKLVVEKATQVPVPIPDTGVSATTSHSSHSSVSTNFRATSQSLASALAAPVSIAIPTTVPTTLNLVSHSPTSQLSASHFTVSRSLISSASTSPSPSAKKVAQSSPPSSSHKLPVAIIAVLAVGSALLLLGIFVIIKACTRPTHRTRPKPSLPILNDTFADDDLYGSTTKFDSPIFGGKEHLSSQNENGALAWSWMQYNEVKPKNDLLGSSKQFSGPPHALNTPVGDFLFPRPLPSQHIPTTLVSSTSHYGIPPHPNALTTAASRLSVARSVSVYPASPAVPITFPDEGKNYTADGYPIMKRTSKVALRRSHSDLAEMAIAYDTADTKSPQFLAHFQPEAPRVPVGRTRIKSSYYTPGSYPRMSSLPSSASTKISNIKVDDVTEFNVPDVPPIHRTASRKDKNTRALTSALGLSSPVETPLSPAQTLYPDDSLSVMGAKKAPNQTHSKKSAASGAMSPLDTSTALGNLMLMDFGTTDRSLSSLAARLGEPIECGSSGCNRPPRVSSPPFLPSLAQLGLEHANPEAYADYRSPTYSIFGLYGDDRKSVH